MESTKITQVVELLAKARMDNADKKKLRKELQAAIEDLSVGLDESEFRDVAKQLVNALNAELAGVGKSINLDDILGMQQPEAFKKLGQIAANDFMDAFSKEFKGFGGDQLNEIVEILRDFQNKLGKDGIKVFNEKNLKDVEEQIAAISAAVDKIAAKSANNLVKSVDEINAAVGRSKDSFSEIESALKPQENVKKKDVKASYEGYVRSVKEKSPWEEQYKWLVKFIGAYETYTAKTKKPSLDDGWQDLYNKRVGGNAIRKNMLQDILNIRDGKPIDRDSEPWAREQTLKEIKSILQNGIQVTDNTKDKSSSDNKSTRNKTHDTENQTPNIDTKTNPVNIVKQAEKAAVTIYRAVQETANGLEEKAAAIETFGAEYWTNSKKVAQTYADDHRGSSDILVGKISPVNPLIIDADNRSWDDFLGMPTLKELFPDLPKIVEEANGITDEIQAWINKQAKLAGFDSVILKNVSDGFGEDLDAEGNAKLSTTYAILDDAIVSVTGAFKEQAGVLDKEGNKTFAKQQGNVPDYYVLPQQMDNEARLTYLREQKKVSDEWYASNIERLKASAKNTNDNTEAAKYLEKLYKENSNRLQAEIAHYESIVDGVKKVEESKQNAVHGTANNSGESGTKEKVAIDENSLRSVLEAITYKVQMIADGNDDAATGKPVTINDTLNVVSPAEGNQIAQENTLQEIKNALSTNTFKVDTGITKETISSAIGDASFSDKIAGKYEEVKFEDIFKPYGTNGEYFNLTTGEIFDSIDAAKQEFHNFYTELYRTAGATLNNSDVVFKEDLVRKFAEEDDSNNLVQVIVQAIKEQGEIIAQAIKIVLPEGAIDGQNGINEADLVGAFNKLTNAINDFIANGDAYSPKDVMRRLLDGDISPSELGAKDAMQMLGMLSGSGKAKFKLASSGAMNQGVAIGDNLVYHATGHDTINDINELIRKTEEAYKLGAAVPRILAAKEEYDNIYQLQTRAPGRNLREYGFDEGVLGASDEQIDRLIHTFEVLEKVGLYPEFGGDNIMYDREKGFTMIDLDNEQDYWNSPSTAREMMDFLQNQFRRSSYQYDGDSADIERFINRLEERFNLLPEERLVNANTPVAKQAKDKGQEIKVTPILDDGAVAKAVEENVRQTPAVVKIDPVIDDNNDDSFHTHNASYYENNDEPFRTHDADYVGILSSVLNEDLTISEFFRGLAEMDELNTSNVFDSTSVLEWESAIEGATASQNKLNDSLREEQQIEQADNANGDIATLNAEASAIRQKTTEQEKFNSALNQEVHSDLSIPVSDVKTNALVPASTDAKENEEVRDMNTLLDAVNAVTQAVKLKTKAFGTERSAVYQVVDDEVAALDELESKILNIKNTLDGLMQNIRSGSDNIGAGLSNINITVNYPQNESPEIDQAAIDKLASAINNAQTKTPETAIDAAGKALATENTLLAIKKAVEEINGKVVKGTKGGGYKRATKSDYKGSPFFGEKLKTREMELAKFAQQLMNDGKDTEEMQEAVRKLKESLKHVNSGERLSVWDQKFRQAKLAVGIDKLKQEPDEKENVQTYKNLIALAKEYYSIVEKYEKAKDGTNRKQILGQQKSDIEAFLRENDIDLSTLAFGDEAYNKKLSDLREKHNRNIETINADKQDKVANDALKERKEIVSELINLQKKLGQLEAKSDEDLFGNVDADQAKKEADAIREQIKQKEKSIEIDEELRKQLDKEKNDSYKETHDDKRNSELKKQQKLYENLGKAQANYEASASSVNKANLDTIQATIAEQEQRLKITQEERAELEKYAVSAQKAQAALLGGKASDKDFKQKVKESKENARMSSARSAINSASNILDSAYLLEGNVTADNVEKIKALHNAVEQLNQKYREVRASDGVVSDQDAKELQDQTRNVKNLSKEVKELVHQYERFDAENVTDIGGFDTSIGDWQKQLTDAVMAATNGKARITGFNHETQELNYTLDTGKYEFTEYAAAIDHTKGRMVSIAGVTKRTETLFEALGRKTKEILTYFGGSSLIYDAFNQVRQGVQYVRDIDSALTELKKVTDETEESYDRFLDTAAKTADKVGSTIKNIVSSTADWGRLGFSMEEAAQLAESTSVLLNVSEFASIEEATSALTSTMQAFGYTADQSMHVVDILNEVGKFVARR